MSPPIRDGSGNDIGSIRLGDGTEISEVRTGAGDVLFSAGPPDSGASHQWSFNKLGNGTLEDTGDSTTLLDGANNGGTVATGAGTNNEYLEFTADGTGVDLGADSKTELSHVINLNATILHWNEPTSDISSGVHVLTGVKSGGTNSFDFGYEGGQPRFELIAANTTPVSIRTQGGGVDIGNWQCIAVTVSSSSVDIYRATEANNYDLKLDVSATPTSSGQNNTLDANVSIGRATLNSDNNRDWVGGIDYSFIDNSTFTQSELQSIVDATKKFYL